MARRASSSIHPGVIVGTIAVIVFAIIAGKSLLGKKTTAFANVAPLDIQEMLDNGNSLRGNEYVIEGEIDEKLRWTSTRGQFVSVKVDTSDGGGLIGVEIPAEFNNRNIEPKQRYAFRVKVRQGGIPVAMGISNL